MADHERIWLQNAEDGKHQFEGRLWCEDKVWPDDPEDGEPTEYVRADLFEALTAEITTLRARLETVEAETRERCAKIYDDERDLRWAQSKAAANGSLEWGEPSHAKMAQGHKALTAGDLAIAIRNLEPRHD